MTAPGQLNTGRCLCGAVRFQTEGKPLWVGHCHCESCRRNTGAALATFVGCAADRCTHTGEAPGVYESSPDVRRRFCTTCGTPISYESERFPGEIHFYISLFDDPDAFQPTFHVFATEGLSWLHLNDGLPRYATTSTAGPPLD